MHAQRKIMMKAGRALEATVLVAGIVASCSGSGDRQRNTAFTTLPDGVGTDSTVPVEPTDTTLPTETETSTTVASSDSSLSSVSVKKVKIRKGKNQGFELNIT